MQIFTTNTNLVLFCNLGIVRCCTHHSRCTSHVFLLSQCILKVRKSLNRDAALMREPEPSIMTEESSDVSSNRSNLKLVCNLETVGTSYC